MKRLIDYLKKVSEEFLCYGYYKYSSREEYNLKLKDYANKIETCGEKRNSFSKTNKDATFMKIKKDYMG